MASVTASDEVLGRMDPEHRRWVQEFGARVRELLRERLRDLRLFGSYARGEAHAESDIDLLVLVDGLDESTWRAVVDLASSISPRLAPLTQDFDRYHAPPSRASGLYEDIRRESVRL
ncbi:MAG: nucleotidyltransferase domain-containing protein [Actinomycetota bacterium]|nr:nucleotidyltransferase domain-containing protein [Actinomycetota bacterium]